MLLLLRLHEDRLLLSSLGFLFYQRQETGRDDRFRHERSLVVVILIVDSLKKKLIGRLKVKVHGISKQRTTKVNIQVVQKTKKVFKEKLRWQKSKSKTLTSARAHVLKLDNQLKANQKLKIVR